MNLSKGYRGHWYMTSLMSLSKGYVDIGTWHTFPKGMCIGWYHWWVFPRVCGHWYMTSLMNLSKGYVWYMTYMNLSKGYWTLVHNITFPKGMWTLVHSLKQFPKGMWTITSLMNLSKGYVENDIIDESFLDIFGMSLSKGYVDIFIPIKLPIFGGLNSNKSAGWIFGTQ